MILITPNTFGSQAPPAPQLQPVISGLKPSNPECCTITQANGKVCGRKIKQNGRCGVHRLRVVDGLDSRYIDLLKETTQYMSSEQQLKYYDDIKLLKLKFYFGSHTSMKLYEKLIIDPDIVTSERILENYVREYPYSYKNELILANFHCIPTMISESFAMDLLKGCEEELFEKIMHTFFHWEVCNFILKRGASRITYKFVKRVSELFPDLIERYSWLLTNHPCMQSYGEKKDTLEECYICNCEDHLTQFHGCTHSICGDCVSKLASPICPFCRVPFVGKTKMKVVIQIAE